MSEYSQGIIDSFPSPGDFRLVNFFRLVALSLCSAVAAASTNAATVTGIFRQIDCDGGGWFEQVIPHPSGRLYGRTDVGGMYRSDDHGGTWRFLSGDLPSNACYYVQGVASPPSNADVVYQAVGVSYYDSDPGRGIWKSLDGGTSWTQILAGVNFSGNDLERWGSECLVIAPDNENEIWAGSRGDGLRRSLNGGATWTNVATGVFDIPNIVIAGITIHPFAPNTIWVAGSQRPPPLMGDPGGVWVSTDRGVNWTKKFTATRIYRVAVKADGTAIAAGRNGNANILYRLTAEGGTTDLYPNYVAAMTYSPGSELAMVQVLANGHIWAADLFEGTCRSTTNGDSFERMDMELVPGSPLPGYMDPDTATVEGGRNGLIQDPTNANRLFLGGGYAPFRSDDGGDTWRYMFSGIGETVAWRASFHPTDQNRVWLPLADLGVTTVNDAGLSGVSTGYIAPHFPHPDDNVMFTHRALVSATKVIAPGGEQATHQPRIYQSTDNGVSWTKLEGAGLPGITAGQPPDPDFANDRELLEAVASADNANDFIVFTAGVIDTAHGGVYRTTNGGVSFTRATGLPLNYDAGAEFYWNVSLERDASDNSVRFALLRNDGFWKSTNRGASWTKPAVQPNGSFGRLRVDPISGRIWVGHAFGLEYSPDGGASWTFLSGVFSSVTEFDAHNARLAVIGRMGSDTTDHIYVSANNGASWDEVTGPGKRFANAQAVAVDPWRPGTVWISTGGRSIARFSPSTPIEAWRHTHFGNTSPTGNAAPSADGEGDGLTTLAEYGFGTSPVAINTARPWQPGQAGGRLVLTFPRNTEATDLTITVQGRRQPLRPLDQSRPQHRRHGARPARHRRDSDRDRRRPQRRSSRSVHHERPRASATLHAHPIRPALASRREDVSPAERPGHEMATSACILNPERPGHAGGFRSPTFFSVNSKRPSVR